MLFLFRSAPEVEKRIHSKLFHKFWRSRGTKEPAYITVVLSIFRFTPYKKRDKPGISYSSFQDAPKTGRKTSFLLFSHTSSGHIFKRQKSMRREDGKFSVEGVISFCRFAETMLPRKCRVSSVRRVAVKENFCCKIFAKLFIHSIHCMRQGWRRSRLQGDQGFSIPGFS